MYGLDQVTQTRTWTRKTDANKTSPKYSETYKMSSKCTCFNLTISSFPSTNPGLFAFHKRCNKLVFLHGLYTDQISIIRAVCAFMQCTGERHSWRHQVARCTESVPLMGTFSCHLRTKHVWRDVVSVKRRNPRQSLTTSLILVKQPRRVFKGIQTTEELPGCQSKFYNLLKIRFPTKGEVSFLRYNKAWEWQLR